jgi:hypothetical protein
MTGSSINITLQKTEHGKVHGYDPKLTCPAKGLAFFH